MAKIFLEARRLYKKLISLQMKVSDNEIEDADGYLHLFKDLLNKFEKVLNKVDIYKLDVDPSYIKTLEKEYSTMVEDAVAFNWQYKYWLYRTPLMKRTKWIASLINSALRKEHQKGTSKNNTNKSIYDVPTVTIKDVEEFLETMLSMDMLENYESDIKRLIRGTYTEPGLYRLWISYKRSDYNNSSSNHAFVKPNNIIEDNVNLSTKMIKNLDNKFISEDEYRLKIYPLLIKNGWVYSINKFLNKYPTHKDFKSFYKKLVNDNNSVKVLFNDELNYMLLAIRDVEIDSKDLLIKFIDFNEPVDYNKLKDDIDDKLYNRVNESVEFKKPTNIVKDNSLYNNIINDFKPFENKKISIKNYIILEELIKKYNFVNIYNNVNMNYIMPLYNSYIRGFIINPSSYEIVNIYNIKRFETSEYGDKLQLILYYYTESDSINNKDYVTLQIIDNLLVNESTEFKKPTNIVNDNTKGFTEILNAFKPYNKKIIGSNIVGNENIISDIIDLLKSNFKISTTPTSFSNLDKSIKNDIKDDLNLIEKNNLHVGFVSIHDSVIYGDKLQVFYYLIYSNDSSEPTDYIMVSLKNNVNESVKSEFKRPENIVKDNLVFNEIINKFKPYENKEFPVLSNNIDIVFDLIHEYEFKDINASTNELKKAHKYYIEKYLSGNGKVNIIDVYNIAKYETEKYGDKLQIIIYFYNYDSYFSGDETDYCKLEIINKMDEDIEFKRPENIINNNLTTLNNLLFKYKPEKNNFFTDDRDKIIQILNDGDFKIDNNFSDDKLFDENLIKYLNKGKTNESIKEFEPYAYLNKDTEKGFLILFYTKSSGEIVSESIVPVYVKDNILYLDNNIIDESMEFKKPTNIINDNLYYNDLFKVAELTKNKIIEDYTPLDKYVQDIFSEYKFEELPKDFNDNIKKKYFFEILQAVGIDECTVKLENSKFFIDKNKNIILLRFSSDKYVYETPDNIYIFLYADTLKPLVDYNFKKFEYVVNDNDIVYESTEFKRPENIVKDNVEINKIKNDLEPYLNHVIKYNYDEEPGESDEFYSIVDKHFNYTTESITKGYKEYKSYMNKVYNKEPYKSFIKKIESYVSEYDFRLNHFLVFDSKYYGDKLQIVIYNFKDMNDSENDYIAAQLIYNTKSKINEGFENPFVNNETNNNEDTELINNIKPKKDNLITKVELWDSNRRLNQIKCLRNKVIANTKFFKGDIVEAAPVITLSHEDLYSKNIRDIVFDISPGKFGIPLGYSSIYRTSADTRNEPNIDYKYDIENNELIFVATKNIDKGEELIIAVDNTVYDNQLTEESFADMFSPSTYEPTENGILGIKALSEPNNSYNPGVSGIAPTSGGL